MLIRPEAACSTQDAGLPTSLCLADGEKEKEMHYQLATIAAASSRLLLCLGDALSSSGFCDCMSVKKCGRVGVSLCEHECERQHFCVNVLSV